MIKHENSSFNQKRAHLSTRNAIFPSGSFDRLAQIAYESGAAKTKQAVIDGLAQREAESTTGFIDGFAIPHAKLKDITEATVIIIQNKAGIEWNALDQTPVTFIIALLIPDAEAGSTHLNLLSSVSRMLVHEDARQQLLEASSPDDILSTFSSYLS
ncbi:PTS sugar transporter subunit IIA [Bacillus licheniformis]|uniref:PTS sugar transporter subunit IIA n=1 Tax=Bacillus licheniformis TaxID=1402 RepID=UPI0030BA26D0